MVNRDKQPSMSPLHPTMPPLCPSALLYTSCPLYTPFHVYLSPSIAPFTGLHDPFYRPVSVVVCGSLWPLLKVSAVPSTGLCGSLYGSLQQLPWVSMVPSTVPSLGIKEPNLHNILILPHNLLKSLLATRIDEIADSKGASNN